MDHGPRRLGSALHKGSASRTRSPSRDRVGREALDPLDPARPAVADGTEQGAGPWVESVQLERCLVKCLPPAATGPRWTPGMAGRSAAAHDLNWFKDAVVAHA
jgi:hypothetical protein